MNKKKIIVIDDEPLISNLMKEIIEEDPNLEVSCITTRREEFLEGLNGHSYDLALMDISVGDREGGIELLKSLRSTGLKMPIIMLSAHDEIHYALKCLKLGASGYVSKECICDDLVRGLKEVMEGHLFVSGPKGKKIVEEFEKSNPVVS